MKATFAIILLAMGIAWHFRSYSGHALRSFYGPALVLKILAGWAVGGVYLYYYPGGDTWNYYHQAVLLGKVAFSQWADFVDVYIHSNYSSITGFAYAHQPRAALLVKMVALLNQLTQANYWIVSMYFSVVSFWGLYSFARWVTTTFSHGKVAALAVLFWPGVLFWSSGVLKESLAVGLLFGLTASILSAQKITVLRIACWVIGWWLLFSLKYYFAVVWAIVMLIYLGATLAKWQKNPVLILAATWLLVVPISVELAGFVHPNLRLSHIMDVIQLNNQLFLAKSPGYTAIYFWPVNNNWLWLLINSPKALWAAVFMPLTLHGGAWLFNLNALQNWVLLFLFLRALYVQYKHPVKWHGLYTLVALSYVVFLGVFLALSTPNVGTLVRYKVAYMPVVLVLVFMGNNLQFKQSRKA